MTAPSSEVRETPTTDALLAEVREGVAAIVRAALAEAERLREQADETLERYDAVTSELARLRLERHALTHELEELPARLHTAKLDALVPDSHGEEPEALESRYVQARERAPVVEARIGRLEAELSNLRAGGDRPAQVNAQGGERRIIKHNANSPALDALNEAAATLQDLHEQLETVIPKTGEELLRTRDRVRDGQNQLWGLAKARR